MTLAAWPGTAQIPVTGTVLADGAPLAGAVVELLPVRTAYQEGLDALAGRLDPEPAAGEVTGDDGFFELTAPEPGLWAVRAAVPGFVPMIAQLDPLVEELALPGVNLRPDEGLAVTVRGPDGDPVAGAMVIGQTRSPDLWIDRRTPGQRYSWDRARSSATTEAEGRALLHRAAGETVGAHGFARRFAPAWVRAGAAGETELQLGVGRQATIAVGAGGSPAAGALVLLGENPWAIGRTGEDGRLPAKLPARGTVRALSESGGFGRTRLRRDADTVSLTLTEPDLAHGTVIDEQTRLPLAGALVWSGGGAERLARTDGAGRFALPDESGNGRFVVQAAAPGYFPAFLPASAGRQAELLVALRAAAAASGVVVDASGEPVVGARVDARLVAGGYLPPGTPRQGDGVRSHAAGEFRLGGIVPGVAVAIQASAPGHAPATVQLAPLEARETRTGLRLVLTPGASLSGRLLGGGEAVAGAELGLEREPETSVWIERFSRRADAALDAASDGEGRFEITHLPAGSYLLRATAAGYAPLTVPGVQLSESGGTDLGDLELEPGASITGIVVDDDGRPVEGAEIRVSGGDLERFGWLSSRAVGGQRMDAVTGADGRFVVPDRRPGERVDVFVFAALDPGLLSATAPSVEAPNATPLRIVLERGARVAGTVVDPAGAPVGNAALRLNVEAGLTAGGTMGVHDKVEHQGQTDEAGRFRFENAPSGILRLSASADGWIGTELSGLEVPPGGELVGLRVVLERGARVSGQVLHADGRPAVGVHVRLQEPAAPTRLPGVMSTSTGADGGYLLEGVPPGLRTIVAQDGRSNRAVGEIEVAAGDNRLDLRFAAGVEVSGRVVDGDGSPVAGAAVALLDETGSRSGPAGLSASDGAFVLEGVRDGRYLLRASGAGHAATTRPEPLEVAGQPVAGIEVPLARAIRLTGELLGLEPAHAARVRVVASRDVNEYALGQVSHDGSYQIFDLAPGVWDVRAFVADGPQAQGRITLDPGLEEARLDLELSSGLTLSGQVLAAAAAVPGVEVHLRGGDVDLQAAMTTDHEGRFRLAGLETGRYRLEIYARDMLVHHESIDLGGDRNVVVELRTGRVAGRVLDADGRAPVAGAAVTLTPEAASPSELRGYGAHGLASGARGSFVLAHVAAGDYQLRAVKEGYAPAGRRIRVTPGGSLEDVELLIEPNAGLRLAVRGATGAPVAEINYAVLDAGGRPLTAGWLPTDANGGARLPSVPAGSFDLLLAAPGAAVTRVPASAPGPPLEVQLAPGCLVDVAVEALATEQVVATMRILAEDGTPFWGLRGGWAKQEWLLRSGAHSIAGVPAGAYRVEVSAADGRSWRARVVVAPGAPGKVRF